MKRTMMLKIKGRRYSGYGNILLLNILNAAADGVVIITPGISPGEADIMWSVLQNGGYVINIQQEELCQEGVENECGLCI